MLRLVRGARRGLRAYRVPLTPKVISFHSPYQRTFHTSPFIQCDSDSSSEGIRSPTSKGLTPAMRQYLRMKESVPGYLLLFQMGDFYEIFYEDAVTASRLLDLTLTSRHKGEHFSRWIK